MFFSRIFFLRIQDAYLAMAGRFRSSRALREARRKTGLADAGVLFLPLPARLLALDALARSLGGQFGGGKKNFFTGKKNDSSTVSVDSILCYM